MEKDKTVNDETKIKTPETDIPEKTEPDKSKVSEEKKSDDKESKVSEEKKSDDKESTESEEKKSDGKSGKGVWYYSKKFIRFVCFFTILGVLMSVCGYALMPKNNSKASGMPNEHSVGFYSQPPGSIDVFFVGNSNTYAAFSPVEMWREYGIQTYTSGVGFETTVEAYTMLVEMFKYHTPKAVVLETDCVFSERRGADTFGEAFEKLAYWEVPLLKYHNRWKDVKFGDMFKSPVYTWHSYSHGQYVSAEVQPCRTVKPIIKTDFVEQMGPISYFGLSSIISLCKEKNVDLMFVYVPCIKSWKYQRHNAIKEIADANGIEFIDYNLMIDDIKIDWLKDTRDKGTHLNVYGAQKISKHMGERLVEKYSLKDLRDNKELSELWEKDYQDYLKQIKRTKQQSVN